MAPSAIAEHPLKEEVVSSKITELVPPPSPDAKRAAGSLRRQSFPGKSLKSKRLPWSQPVSAA